MGKTSLQLPSAGLLTPGRRQLSTAFRGYPQLAPSLCGAAQAPTSAGNIRGMGAGAERVTDRSQTEHQDERRRVTVSEAADILGITAEAVRTRIKRGRLDSVKVPPQPGGTVYVLLEADQTGPNTDPTSQVQDQTTGQTPPDAAERFAEAMIEELRDRVRYLERVLEEEREARTDERRRHDTLMAQLMQRIPELEPPAPPESPEPREPGPHRVRPERAEPVEPGAPRREEPERIQPQRVEPERVEPERIEPERVEAPRNARESPDSPGPTRTPTDAGEGQETATGRPWWRFWR